MLAAVDAGGKLKMLTGPQSKENAIRLKNIPLFCPQCGQPVVVKAGDVNIPHFAHRSTFSCNFFSEPESPRHLAGKNDLFQWITKTHPATLESVLPDGKQRPDILSENIAVEFQCSTISASLFQKRTDYYIKRGFIPFWIYGGKPIERKSKFIKLTPFQRLFLRYHDQLGFYFICYCPDAKLFTIYGRLVLVTPTLFAADRLNIPIEKMVFPPSAAFSTNFSFQLEWFHDEKRKWIDHSLYYKKARSHPFFKAVYNSGANPYLLPEHIGLPVRSSLAIRNHPIEWQFYIMLDKKRSSAEEIILRRIELGHLKKQNLPLAGSMTVEQAAKDYVELINQIGEVPLTSQFSMMAKLQNEKVFRISHEKQILDKLIF